MEVKLAGEGGRENPFNPQPSGAPRSNSKQLRGGLFGSALQGDGEEEIVYPGREQRPRSGSNPSFTVTFGYCTAFWYVGVTSVTEQRRSAITNPAEDLRAGVAEAEEIVSAIETLRSHRKSSMQRWSLTWPREEVRKNERRIDDYMGYITV